MAAPTSLKDTRVKRFSPTGASDSLDATDEFPGACTWLANLVPDITTRNLWTCRPAVVLATDFSTWPTTATPGFVSVFKIVGSVAYGLCGDLGSGTDKPFAYNLATNAFLPMALVGSPVFPTTMSSTLAPLAAVSPTIDLVGSILVITHPSYPLTSGGCRGYIDITTPLLPAYGSGDLTGAITFVGLGAIPSWVAQFNERAYYGVNSTAPSVVASDVLVPGHVTNAGQALTFDDNKPLVTAAPLGLSNQLGGIIQSLMVFKVDNIYQVTGDFSGSTWARNTLNVATGTFAPRGVCSTPLGLAFISPTGLRIIDPNGTVGEPIGALGKGVNVPFINQANVFATVIGCDAYTIRISVEINASLTPPSYINGFVEYWYSIPAGTWSGPHSIFPVQYSTYNGNFYVVFSTLIGPKGIYMADTNSYATGTTFTEFGSPMSFYMRSAMLEDSGQMAQSELAEMQLVAGSFAPNTMTVTLLDADGNTINTANPLVINSSGAKIAARPYRVDFPAISVFNRMAIQITGTSGAEVRLGDSWMRLRTLAYVISEQTPSS